MKKIQTLCLLTLLFSCEDDDSGLNLNPINSNIIIEVREVLAPNSRELTLFCQTERSYPCINFPILTENQQDGNSINITFTSVEETDFCFTALGPATTSIDLHTLPNGEYEIELNNQSLKNTGTLFVTETDISLQFGSTNGIEFVRETTKRVPENTYWGAIGFHVEASSTLVEEFVQKFKDAGAVFNIQSPGHYFYYEIDDSGEIFAEVENSGYYFLEKFIFQYDGDEEKLKELVQVKGKEYHEALYISIGTYKGEHFNNWGN
ncbi:hypothetical protein [Lunatibacter salilacus]|uniref:hypothetical protein n=1 Tax=Lunatibacter salilacus TaxID=2483804 RepID=UPI00131C8B3B|nr:hypothetical protein [Lunatibacter salilacus]